MREDGNIVNQYLINFIGIILIIIGIITAFFAPLEIYSYYFFTEGGRFYYEGFGFGSFMFGSIAVQIIGYYIIAAIFIPLGYGHLKKKKWIQKVSLTFLWVWLIIGLPILAFFLFVFVSTKQPSVLIVLFSIILCILLYTLIPYLLIKFYKSKTTSLILLNNENNFNIIRKYPVPLLVIITLYLFYILVLHLLLLFKGIFPFFGNWLFGIEGAITITISILYLIALIVGTINYKLLSWWASVIYFSFFIISLIITLFSSNLTEIITILKFPPTEANALLNIPLESIHLSLIFGIPLILTIGLTIYSRKYFIKLRL